MQKNNGMYIVEFVRIVDGQIIEKSFDGLTSLSHVAKWAYERGLKVTDLYKAVAV